MATQERITRQATLRARNIGGIDETTVELESGVTVLAGRNATNRTSLLQAFMAALGGEYASLKADADEGEAVLELDDETYRRTLRRSGGTTVMGGEPYLEDAELADLFAFLLESNPARRAVTTGDDLREIILRPVDTDEIEAEITRLTAEKDQINDELERLETIQTDLPELERQRTTLQDRIEEKRAELEEVKEAIENAESEIERRQDDQNELEEKLSELRERRSDLEDVRFDLETERESLAALRDEREELEADREDLPDVESLDREAIDEEIDRLQRQSQEIDGVVSQLQSIVQFNEEMLEGSHPEIRELLADETDGESAEAVTEQLLEDEETVQCWTCGSEVRRSEIESTIDRLRSLQEEKLSERDELEERIQSLRSDRREIDQARRKRERIEDRLEDVTDEIDRRERRLEELTDRRDELESEIDELESEAADLEDQSESGSESESDDETEETDDGSLLELNRRANELEFSLGRLERDLETTTDEIEEIESALEERERLEERREEIREDLEELRTRIDRIEREAVESFNEHMDAVLEVLEYDNIDRIWIERVGETVREGRRTVERTAFDLHIVRSTEDGQTYEDTIDHLSESEREVTGLIFALAGYLVHEVYDDVPFMLLDSLEALDSNRIAALVEYFREYTDFLVVALLPEDAEAIDDSHERITEI
ncbi:chromosome segregation protein SMC [Halobiforma lacisalsi AJ5]|uniref:Chromosome segregation protein SMC n=1 Tax=Natronobacterium lacisalsi AJ5 TaxID=358396 RepID=M0LEQ4_NATLA|nr:archaea-specific SMC-related protein [Halobiforma lacisalsi]APW96655.1 chromosome segregation protein SMC [Halobiforma lacisalsi AJ5]EMA32062.1 Kinetochore-Ndc80 complex subunit Spc25 [Halobiforma lacisalsi AJ5]